MVSKKLDDGALPSGWKLQIKSLSNNRKIKCYVNSKTQKKFYSRASMLRYIKDTSIANKRSGATKEHAKKSPEKKKQVDATDGVEADDSNDGLPSGWIMETRIRQSGTRKGTPYKCYIDPESGSKFFSKPEVCRYLESTQRSGGSSLQKEKGSTKPSTSNKSDPPSPPPKSGLDSNVSQLSKANVQKSHSSGKLEVVVQKVIDEELPSGWIKEIRNKMNGEKVARSDPFYIDTATGLVFRSKPDALRYVQTGEISRHAYRRKNGSITDEELALVKSTPPSSGEREKEAKPTTSKQLFADEATPKQCTSAPAEIKETGNRRTTRSSSRSGLAPPVHEASLQQTKVDEASPKECISTLPETSVTKETGSRRTTRSSSKAGVATKTQLFADEVSPQQWTSALPEANDMKETGSRRKTRASSGVGSAPLHEASLELGNTTPTPLQHEVTTDKQLADEVCGVKETGRKRKTRASSGVGPAPLHEAGLELGNTAPTPLQPEVTTDKQLFADEVCGVKETGSRRKTRSSSKAELAPLSEASIEQSQKPVSAEPETSGIIETGSRRSTRSSSTVGLAPSQEAGLEHSKPSTVLSDDMLIEEEPETVALKDSGNQKTRASKRKMKDRKTPTLPLHSSKRLAKEEDSDTNVVFEAIPIQDALRAISRKSTKTQGSPILGSIPFGEKPQTVNGTAQNGLASPDEKLRAVNSDAQTVLATPENSSKAVNIVIDIVSQINAQVLEIDLEEYPPGFAPNPSTETSIKKVDQPSLDLTDKLGGAQTEKSPTQPTERQQLETLPESKIGGSFGIGPILEEKKDVALRTEPGKTTGDHLTQLEQPAPAPESQFSLSSSLWSDPCLEFAYKTLTGAIPLDDNLAIEDYIQHQLRTSSQQSNIPNSNGFGSQTPRR